jgi:hypothetical protein
MGHVSAASTSGEGIPAVGDTYTAPICISSSGKLSLPKGSDLQL